MLLLIQCIFRGRTVNLNKCKTEAGAILGCTDLKLHNVYTRFIRFFKKKNIDAFCIGITWLIIWLVDFKGAVYMVMDRSNWKIGQVNINVLFVGLLLPNGIFIPVIWENLDKRGNSNEAERISLMERFCEVWKDHTGLNITLLADREFIGKKWFTFLKELQWSFVIRLRYQDYLGEVAVSLGKTIYKTEKLIERKVKRDGFFQSRIKLNGHECFYTVLPNKGTRKGNKKADRFVILISNFKQIQLISDSYRRRWGIEVFFYHCKTNGFNLEDLNLTKLIKAQLMMGLVAVAYVLCILKGQQCQRTQKVYLKKNKGKKSRAVSIFRLGYDTLKNTLHVWEDFIRFIRYWLKPLSRNFQKSSKTILKSV